MAIKRYPPSYDKNKKYPPQYNLESIDVFIEAPAGDYFNVSGLPSEIGFGKHAFNLNISEPAGGVRLKNYGNILIEAKDANGTLIYSGITDISDASGTTICYLWIKQDPLRTQKNIVDGQGTLTIVGQLENVPNQYRDVYNLRTTIPLNIRKDYSNVSSILFQSSSLIKDTLTIEEKLEADIDNLNFNRSYADITIKNLETFSGEVDSIQISYLESGSLSGLSDNDFTLLTQQRIQRASASFEDEIDFRIADGLNPISQTFRVLMPPMANQSGSDFGLADNKFKFKFEFLNKNNEKAKSIRTNGDLQITSSFVNFAGPATVITGEDNLVAGQLFVGSSLAGAGMEFNGGSSAFLRSIGYLGFTSASAGSGSGFMLYSGSVLGANTDDYSSGGVGFEFVQDSSSFMRFGTADSLFDIRAKKFFVGSEDTQFVSGSGNNIEISSSGFHLKADGSVTMSGKLAVEAGGEIGGFTISDTALSTTAFVLSSSQDVDDPVSFISSSRFKVSAGGVLTASAAFIEGAVITGSTNIDVANDIKVKGIKVAGLSTDDTIIVGGDTAQITASSAQITDLISTHITASSITSSGNIVGNELQINQTLKSTTGLISASAALSASKIIGAQGAFFGGDIDVIGNVTATTFTTQEITTETSEGSTIFGNSNDDLHRFTGSLAIHRTGSGNETGFFLTGSQLRVENDISASGDFYSGTEKLVKTDGTGTDNEIAVFTDANTLEGATNFTISDVNTMNIGGTHLNITAGATQVSNYIGGASGNTLSYIQFGTANKLRFYAKNEEMIVLDGHSDIITFGDGGGIDYKFRTLNDDNTLYIEGSSDNVGIGTTTPGEKLEVVGNISASGRLNVTHITASGGSSFGANVGIGTAAPSRTLTVAGADGTLPLFNLVNTSTSTGEDVYMSFNRDNGDSQGFSIGLDSSDNFFKIAEDGNSLTTLTRMVIDTAGNVGIGTSSPTKKLEVVGDISASGVVYAARFESSGSADSIDIVDSIDVTGNITASGGISATNLDISGDIDVDGTTHLDVVDIDDNVDIAGTLTLNNQTTTTDFISSPFYQSGFAGSGWRIESGSTATSLTVDDLTVRNTFSVYEMLIHQIRATNGSLFIANTGKIISASITDAAEKEFELFFDTGSGYGHSFRPGDLIRAQRFTPDANGSGSADGQASFKSDLTIVSLTGTTSSIARLTGSTDVGSTDIPQPGYEYVRMGNLTSGSRQGSIYLTADDANAPFIDVADGIQKHEEFNTSGKVKVRIGKLSGITSTTFSTIGSGINEYGFYASGSAFLEGSINATGGSIGGWDISQTQISSTNITIDSGNENILLGSATALNSGTGIFLNGSGHFRAGNPSGNFIKFDGSDVSITAGNFGLDTSGNMTATNVDLTGEIKATSGNIGGFAITDSAITGSSFVLSGSATNNDMFISASNFNIKASGQITASTLLLSGSGGTNFLQFKAGALTVRGDVAATTISTPSASLSEGGNLVATSGSIAGFNFENGTMSAGKTRISSTGTNGFIEVGDLSGIDTEGGTDKGIFLKGDGGAIFKATTTANSDFIKIKSTEGVKINSSNVDISGSNVRIGAPRFLLGDNSNFISGSNGNLKIVTGDATLSGSSVDILTSNFFLGNETNFISGSSDGIKLVSEEVTLSGSSIDIITPEFFFGELQTLENAQFISGSNGNIEISSSGFHLNGGNIVANNADLSGKLTSTEGSIGGFSIDATTISSSNGTLILNNAGQITASAVSMSGTIVTDDITATAGKIGGFTLGSSKLSSGNLFAISASSVSGELFISSSNFKVKNTGQITGSEVLFTGGEVAGFKISSTELSASGVRLKTTGRFSGGQITSSNVLFDGGKIGGFTISDSVLSIDNIKLSSKEKGLVISSSDGFGRVLISSGSLSSTAGSSENRFVGAGFEELTSNFVIEGGASGDANVGSWYFENDSRGVSGQQEELWNSGSISMSVAISDAAVGSKHITINVSKELGPFGEGAGQDLG